MAAVTHGAGGLCPIIKLFCIPQVTIFL